MSPRPTWRKDQDDILQALFGSHVTLDDDGTAQQRAPMEDLEVRLPESLSAMVTSRFRWILILEPTSARYVQFLATEDAGALVAECVSNHFLTGDDRLSEDAEELLPVLGWDWPAPPNQPNWRAIEFHEEAALDLAVLALHTLRRVFDCSDGDEVTVKFFRSPTRARSSTT